MGAHLLRRLDAVASDLGMDRPEAIHAALLHWLEKKERETTVRNRMLRVRAWPKTAVSSATSPSSEMAFAPGVQPGRGARPSSAVRSSIG